MKLLLTHSLVCGRQVSMAAAAAGGGGGGSDTKVPARSRCALLGLDPTTDLQSMQLVHKYLLDRAHAESAHRKWCMTITDEFEKAFREAHTLVDKAKSLHTYEERLELWVRLGLGQLVYRQQTGLAAWEHRLKTVRKFPVVGTRDWIEAPAIQGEIPPLTHQEVAYPISAAVEFINLTPAVAHGVALSVSEGILQRAVLGDPTHGVVTVFASPGDALESMLEPWELNRIKYTSGYHYTLPAPVDGDDCDPAVGICYVRFQLLKKGILSKNRTREDLALVRSACHAAFARETSPLECVSVSFNNGTVVSALCVRNPTLQKLASLHADASASLE